MTTSLFFSVGLCFGGRAIIGWTCDPCSPCSLWRPCIIAGIALHYAYRVSITVNKGLTVYITFVRALAVSSVDNAVKNLNKSLRRVYGETSVFCLLIGGIYH